MWLLAFGFSLAAFPPFPFALSAQSKTGAIVGQVIDGTTGRPVSGVLVYLDVPPEHVTPDGRPPRPVMTNDAGGFVFSGLTAGTYGITATRSGYVEGAYGRLRPNGQPMPLQLADAERRNDVRVRVWKYGAISGTVTDETGEALVGVRVQALRTTFSAGHRRLVSEGTTFTDDRGAYRLGELLPGDYVIVVPSTQTTLPADIAAEAASDNISSPVAPAIREMHLMRSPMVAGKSVSTSGGTFVMQPSVLALTTIGSGAASNGRPAVYPTTYNGDITSARQAPVIAIGSGEVRGGIDVHIRPTPTWSVSGRLVGGDRVAVQVLRLFSATSDDDFNSTTGLEAAIAITDRSGAFTFVGVPAGPYVLRGNTAPEFRPGRGGPPAANTPSDTWWINEPVVVGNQDVTLTAVWREAFNVSGRAAFDGPNPPRFDSLRVPILLESADQRPGVSTQVPSRFTPEGTFSTDRVSAGRYLVRVGSSPPGWTLKSVLHDGRDISETGVDLKGPVTDVVITFTNRITSLSGLVSNALHLGSAEATALLFPVEPTGWQDFGLNPRRLKSARAATNGRYEFADVPPGDYFVIAIPEEQATVWREPDRLAAFSRLATRVHLSEGQNTTLDLRLVEIR